MKNNQRNKMEALRPLNLDETYQTAEIVPFVGRELAQEIDQNLLQLEQDFAFFKFAINEIKDITK